MIRRTLAGGAVLVTVLLVQVTVLPVLLRPGFQPDLVTVVTVLLTLERGTRSGLWFAGVGGLAADLLSVSAPLGGGIAIAAAAAAVAGLARPYLGDRAELPAVLLAGLSCGAAFLLAGLLGTLVATEPRLVPGMLGAGAAVTSALGALLAPLLLAMLRLALGPADSPTSGVVA
jgi:rod shape-determining protein MreD